MHSYSQTDEKSRSADTKVAVQEMMKLAWRGVSVAMDAGTHSHKGNLSHACLYTLAPHILFRERLHEP